MSRLRIRHRHGVEQPAGVGVRGLLEYLLAGADFHNAAEIHDRDPVADALHYRHVVGNEKVSKLELPLEIQQQVDDLRLDGDVQRRHRLVGDHQPGIQRDCSSDAHPLPLTAGELMRKAPVVRGLETHPIHQRVHPHAARVAPVDSMDDQRLGDGFTDAHARVE